MEGRYTGELLGAICRVDRHRPWQVSRRAKCLLVCPVAPATDRLAKRHTRHNQIRPGEKRLSMTAGIPPHHQYPGDQGAMDRHSTLTHVDRLGGCLLYTSP